MVYTVSITSQGQITIPAKIRRALGLNKKQQATVSIEEGKMVVKPVKDLLELEGAFKTDKKPLTNDELHDLFAQGMADEYAQKLKRLK